MIERISNDELLYDIIFFLKRFIEDDQYDPVAEKRIAEQLLEDLTNLVETT